MRDDPYWNDAAFAGASLGYGQLVSVDDQRRAALAWFAAGRARLTGG